MKVNAIYAMKHNQEKKNQGKPSRERKEAREAKRYNG